MTGSSESTAGASSKFLRIGALAGAERLAFYAWMNPVLVAWVATFDNAAPIGIGLLRIVAGKGVVGVALGNKVLGLANAAFFLALILGGIVADRWLGARRASIAGSVLASAGLFLLATDQLGLLSLGLLVAGAGLARTTIPPQIAAMYPERTRQEQAIALFYLATYVGISAALVTGTCGSPGIAVCGEVTDIGTWRSLNVPIAGVVMAACLVVFARRPAPVGPALDVRKLRPRALASILGVALAFFGISITQVFLLNELLASKTDLAILPFSDWQVPPHWLGQLPVNLVCMFLITPLIVVHWGRQARSGRPSSSAQKLAISCLYVAGGFMVLVLPELRSGQSSGWWLILSTFLLTVGEVYFAASALAGIMRCVPGRHASVSVAVLFLFRDFLCDYLAVALLSVRAQMSQVGFTIAMAAASMLVAAAIIIVRRSLDASDDVLCGGES
jgi:proton-dependent oligopeptide transporter, POT family